MRKLRTGTPLSVEWDAEDIMSYLGCDITKAKEIMENCRCHNNLKGYSSIDKHLILDFINMKQREEREREARHQSDLANIETSSTLKEQVKTLQKLYDSSSADARKAHTQSLIANFISTISLIIALLALVLK